MNQSNQDRVMQLLRELTEWQLASGLPPIGSSDVASTGEATAAIEDLKLKLEQLGARYYWSESANEYQLKTDEPLNPFSNEGGKQ